jgi:hypothetical protein
MMNQRNSWSEKAPQPVPVSPRENRRGNYEPRESRPSQRREQIKSFRDLEVYRESVLLCADVVQQLFPLAQKRKFLKRNRLRGAALSIPGMVADGYGMRFYDRAKGLAKLHAAILFCNRIVCYCDLMCEAFVVSAEEKARCDEILEKYFFLRLKLQNFQKSWEKWSDTPRSGGGKSKVVIRERQDTLRSPERQVIHPKRGGGSGGRVSR